MTKALALDFGGVISQTPFETHRATERALGIAQGSLTWLGPFDAASDSLWQAMQREEITEREYWLTRAKETGELIGKRWTTMREFIIAARSNKPMEIIRPEFLAALAVVKAGGCKLGILSNELDLFYGADFRTKLPFMNDFDVIIDATYTEVLKPDPRAYVMLLNDLGTAAQDTVFVDDQARNIVGAQRAGMVTVHFDVTRAAASYAEVLEKLEITR